MGPSGLPISRSPAEQKRGGPPGNEAGEAGPPVLLLAPCAKERAQTGGWGAGLRGLRQLLFNAQEVKLVVLGAELGRRLKKKKKSQRQRSFSRKQLSLKTLGAQCPRPDPAGRSAAPVLRLPPWWGRPRGLTEHRHCGGDQRALPGSPLPAAGHCAGAPRTLSARDFGSGEQDSSGKETSGGEAVAAGLRRLPLGASTPAFPGPDGEERPRPACARGPPRPPAASCCAR